ncbi:hypothetical protein BEP68_17885 [Microbacterium sp. 4-7]|nr:hypothetical protein [Microbacterium sp. 4-7]
MIAFIDRQGRPFSASSCVMTRARMCRAAFLSIGFGSDMGALIRDQEAVATGASSGSMTN